jgi:serine/threonine protein kinase
MWFRVARAKAVARKQLAVDQSAEVPKDNPDSNQTPVKLRSKKIRLRKNIAEHLKTPLPKILIFEKTYDFFDGVPKKFHGFIKKSLKLSNLKNGAKIITSPRLIDSRGHVTEGRIGNIKVVLKRSKDDTPQNERENFYAFMDVVKQKLRKLAAIENDDTLSDEDKKSRSQYIRSQLTGLSNIVPIIGIAKFRQQDESSPETFIDETVEILPKVNGYTLRDCIKKKLPPYDTPRGAPRNQKIAINLLLQLASAYFTLHSCGYVHNDLNRKNIMISRNNLTFALKLIDWGSLMDHPSSKDKKSPDFTSYIYDFNRLFLWILFGQLLETKISDLLEKHQKNLDEHQAEIFQIECQNSFIQTGIYSPKVARELAQLISEMLYNNSNIPSLETILLRLKALLTEKNENESEKF